MREKESRPGENTEATNPKTDHHHTTGSPDSDGSGHGGNNALADPFHRQPRCTSRGGSRAASGAANRAMSTPPVSDIPSSQMRYGVNEIVRRVGPAVAVVHAILAANDDGDGSLMTRRAGAKAASITRTTAPAVHRPVL